MTDVPLHRRSAAARLDEGELELWRERLAAVPDLRIAKIMRARRAIATDSYDEQAILDRTIDLIQDDVGIMCRAEFDPF